MTKKIYNVVYPREGSDGKTYWEIGCGGQFGQQFLASTDQALPYTRIGGRICT